MTLLPDYLEFKRYPKPPVKSLFTAASDDALDLLERLLSYDPNRRPTVIEALQHPYFTNSPRPTAPARLPKPAPRIPRDSRA